MGSPVTTSPRGATFEKSAALRRVSIPKVLVWLLVLGTCVATRSLVVSARVASVWRGGLELGAPMLQVPNWPNLKEILLFWHHLPFSGAVWSLSPNFDTEFRSLFLFVSQGRVMGSNAN